MKKENKIEIPDLKDIEILEEDDIIKLGDSLLEAFKKKLGDNKLYVVYYSSWKNFYQCEEAMPKDICFSRESYNSWTQLNFHNIYGKIDCIFRDKDKAINYTNQKNLGNYKKEMEDLKSQIDECNPIKVMEECEKKKQKLIESYLSLKEKVKVLESEEKDNIEK